MTVPQVNPDTKSPSGGIAIIDNFDDTRSTIGLQSEYNHSIVSMNGISVRSSK